MTITQLKYVLAVAENQNFTKAAQKTFVTQPTLSMQIQKLEDELDIQIFDFERQYGKMENDDNQKSFRWRFHSLLFAKGCVCSFKSHPQCV